jgi:uncharacterized protein (DUF1697 family)
MPDDFGLSSTDTIIRSPDPGRIGSIHSDSSPGFICPGIRQLEREERNFSMQTFVALMRGINVGSARKLPMGDLRALCGSLGLERPQTYIQSGNLLVEAKGGEAALRRLLEKELADRFGFTVDVIVRTAAEWEGYVAANPFAGDTKALPKMVHLYLPRDPLKSRAAKTLEQRAQMGERVGFAGGALWIDYGANGVARSKLSPLLIDRACGSPTTGRNWNSVLTISKMIAQRVAK